MERPICLASNAPPRNPTRPLISANSVASAKNNAETGKSPAPSAFINPISLLRSKIGRHSRRNRQRRSQQSGNRNQQHQSLYARENRPFVLCYLPNLLSVRVRNGFLQLICNRLRVRRAVPAIVLRASQAGRIAAGEGIFRLGQSTDVNTAHRARPPDDLLGQRKWRDDLVVFRSACRKNAGNCMALTGDFNLISRMACDPCRQPLTEENALRTVIRPLTLDFPPGVRRLDSGHEVLFSELNM